MISNKINQKIEYINYRISKSFPPSKRYPKSSMKIITDGKAIVYRYKMGCIERLWPVGGGDSIAKINYFYNELTA